jgi:hypothetical protein
MMKSFAGLLVAALLSPCSARGADIDVGVVDQKLPKKSELIAPKTDDGIAVVGLRETIKGKVPKDDKRKLYIVVNPVSNPDTYNVWWTQQDVSRDGDSFSAVAQFGDGDRGKGEYFVVLAVLTDNNWSSGEKLDGLPDNATYSKIKIVKRK